MDLKVLPLQQPKQKISDESQLAFGRQFTDRMFVMDYTVGRGWHDARIQPYAKFELDPATLVFHYAQEIFEGLKAYRRADGSICLFRPQDNIARMNLGSERMCMPPTDPEFTFEALKELLRLEADWVPHSEGTSLYIRPTMIATEPIIGLKSSDTFTYYIILSPTGAYYKNGVAPIKILVEDEYVRAAPGGTGEAKTGGNYAASLLAFRKAAEAGCDQVLWLDAAERKYIEEVGTSNICVIRDGKLVTSPLAGTILDGITRRSILQLAKDRGIEVVEQALAIDELFEGIQSGAITEAFGCGTAVVVSPIGQFTYKGDTVQVADGQPGKVTMGLYKTLTDIQTGKADDPYGWVVTL